MRKLIQLMFAVAIATASITVDAQTTVVGRLNTEIVIPITVVENEQLNFGRVISTGEGGMILISPKSERLATGNVRMLDDRFSAGKFLLSAAPNSLVSVLLPQTPQKMFLNNTSHELTVDNFISDVPTGGYVFGSTKTNFEVSVGASLHVGNWSNNPAGVYSGTYEIVFTYN